MKSLRVCFVIDAWSPVWGGGQEHTLEVAKRLVSNYECTVDILVPNLVDQKNKCYPKVENLAPRLRVIRVGPSYKFPNFFGRIYFGIYENVYLLYQHYDIVHSQHYTTSIMLPLISLVTKAKVGYTIHGAVRQMLGAGILNNLGIPQLIKNLLIFLKVDFRMSAAKASVRDMNFRFTIVGNGVNVGEFRQEQLPKKNKNFTILCVSRNDPIKGLHVLKKAITKLKHVIPNLKLNLVINRRRVVSDFINSDLYVLPSFDEGLPIVILEAMAAKLPIVATNVGDVGEIVMNAKCGVVVSPGDVNALSLAIRGMYKNKQRKILGTNGYKYLIKNYTWDKVTACIYEEYKKIIN